MLQGMRLWIIRVLKESDKSKEQLLTTSDTDHKNLEVSTDKSIPSFEPPFPYDENLLEQARNQWLVGDWTGLSEIPRDKLQHHPDRAKLALLAAAGHAQQGQAEQAHQLTHLALNWGCSKKLVAQILIAGVHNSIGRAAVIAGIFQRALPHMEIALTLGFPATDKPSLKKTRIFYQLEQLKNKSNLSTDEANLYLLQTKLEHQQNIDKHHNKQGYFETSNIYQNNETLKTQKITNQPITQPSNINQTPQNNYQNQTQNETCKIKKYWEEEGTKKVISYLNQELNFQNLRDIEDERLLLLISPLFHKKSIIDIGAGVGRLIPLWNLLESKATLLENSSAFLPKLIKRAEPYNHEIITHDITTSLNNKYFDTSFCTQVLLHIHPDKIRKTIENITSISKISVYVTYFDPEKSFDSKDTEKIHSFNHNYPEIFAEVNAEIHLELDLHFKPTKTKKHRKNKVYITINHQKRTEHHENQ